MRQLTTLDIEQCCKASALASGLNADGCGVLIRNGRVVSWGNLAEPIQQIEQGEGIVVMDTDDPCRKALRYRFNAQNINAFAFEHCGLVVRDGLVQALPDAERMATDVAEDIQLPIAWEFDARLQLISTYDPESCGIKITHRPTQADAIDGTVVHYVDLHCKCTENTDTSKLRLYLSRLEDGQYRVTYVPQEQPVNAAAWSVTDLPDGATYGTLQAGQTALNAAAALGSTSCEVTCG